MKRLHSVFGLSVLACLASLALQAQITGELRGTVSDASGAAIPKAAVTLTSLGTRQVRSQAANVAGEFSFDLLPVGDYQIKAAATGFSAVESAALVRTGEVTGVSLRLTVGSITQTVEVTGAVAQIDTENGQLQTSVTGEAIQEIPVNRNPNLFALMAPGVAPVSINNSFLGSGSFNSNGGRGRGNNIMVDGITATDVSATGTGGAIGPLNFSSIKEVKIITNSFSAEYGRNSSSQVLYITKGGTNSVHGELYEYLQNNEFNARGFFDRTGGPSVIRANTYGYELGGPLFIPKIFDGRNKFFWHTDYEGFKQRGTGAPVIAIVPTAAQLATITDPTSLAIAKQYQWPTSPSGTLAQSAPNKADTYEWSTRGDVILGKKDTLWSRYAVYDSIQDSTGNTFISSNLLGFGARSVNHPRQATLAETHLFGPNMVNEFRFGFGQSKPSFPIQTPYPFGPQINFTDGFASLGVSSALPQGREQRTFQYTDNFSITHGSHYIKAGFEWYHLEADSFFDNNLRSTITFASFAAFAAGQPSTWTQNFGNSVRLNRVENQFAFVQDDWKVMRNLTLNLGVRYEHAGGPTEANGLISNLNLDNHTAYGAAGAGPLGLLEAGKPSFHSNNNWAPRFGFAWQPYNDQKTVVRGGYGISYDFVFLNPITNQRFLPPFIYAGTLSGVASFTGPNSFANFYGGSAALQQSLQSQVGTLSTTLKNFGAISPAIAQNLANAEVHQWNLGIERELMNNLVLKAAYVGTRGTHLSRTHAINLIADANAPVPATSAADETARLAQFTTAFAGLNGSPTAPSNRYDPRYNAVSYVESSANSIYHSLQIEVQKRFSSQFFANLSYTWAHSMDDNSDVLGVLENDITSQQNPRDNANNRSASQFDLRHTIAITHTWEMPFFAKSSNRMLRGGLAGWEFSGISTYHSGFPINIFAGAAPGGLTDPLIYLGNVTTVTDRPNVAGPITNFDPQPAGSAIANSRNVTTTVNGVPLNNYAASLGLSRPLLGNFGTLGRNSLRLNGQTNFDMNIAKNFHFTERANFQLRGEFYNIFNLHAFRTLSSSNINSASFGQYGTVSLNARTVQLAARIVF